MTKLKYINSSSNKISVLTNFMSPVSFTTRANIGKALIF